MADCDVLVCGLGPVGQLLAHLLGARGVHTIAIDRAHEPYVLPRAAVIDDEVLRILQSVGLDDAVLADAQVQPGASIVTAAGRAVDVLRAQRGRLGHPPLVSINQPAMERTMVAALAGRPSVDVRWGHQLDVLDRRADGVHAYVRPVEGGRAERISARWVVGCDGAASAVRRRLGVSFDGKTSPQRWVVVDALVDRPLRKVPHPYFVGANERPIVTLPMSPGRHRWEWMVRPTEDPSPFLHPDAIRRGIEPWLDGETAEVERAVVYTFHTRTAERWRLGRVLLAGDAAHVMPPFAGQGFSSGARDAGNLAWKLADVLAGAPASLLDTYEVERRPHVAAMQRLAVTLGAVVQTTRPRAAALRDRALAAIDQTAVQHVMCTNVKPLPTYPAGAFAWRPHRLPNRRAVGSLFPQTDRLDDALGVGWSAVATDPTSRVRLEAAGLPVVDPGPDRAWLDARELTWALLRPDRFVFACGREGQATSACAAWERTIGAAAPGRLDLPAATAVRARLG